MTAKQFLLALAEGIGLGAIVAAASMALHLQAIWPGVLMAFGLRMLRAALGAHRRGGAR